MTKITKSRLINAPADKVWSVIGDFNNVHIFHPFVESADQLNEVDRGVGAKRQCNLYNSSSQVEEVIEWEEGKSFTVLASSTAFSIFGDTTGTMHVEPIDTNSSKVILDTTYAPNWGILGKILDLLILRMGVSFALGRVLKSLQHHIETGQLVGKGGKLIQLNI